MELPKSLIRKKSKEDEQTLTDLSSAHKHLQAQCQLQYSSTQKNYIKQIKFSFCPINIIDTLLNELSWSV